MTRPHAQPPSDASSTILRSRGSIHEANRMERSKSNPATSSCKATLRAAILRLRKADR
jgi:hypothetical protein